ncbi:MAG TPA: ATP-binding protein [Bryobacteraceae bacterium]|jgi:signal transduction histidine kinase|nr:ATP-binding protein [Bryobacteraceae bacterium]
MSASSTDRPFRNARFALTVGFGSLLLVMALTGGDALLVLRQVRRGDYGIRRQFLFRNHTLNEVRSELYLSGTYVRDYLLEPEPARAETFRANLEDVRKRMQAALGEYEGQLNAGERPQYAALTNELAGYWNILSPIMRWTAAERRARGYIFLRDDVYPRRAVMLEIAGRIADLNEQQMNAGSDRVGELLVKFQTRLSVTLLTALAIGLGMALFSTRHILRLEASSQLRYQEAAEARKQLTNLSAKLVQAQEVERRALSIELHDEVGQALSAVLVELKNLSIRLEGQPPAASLRNVEAIKGLVEGTVRVVRNMALLLRPSMLDDLGLIPALRWQAREMSKRTSIDVGVSNELTSDDLPEQFKTCLYRVVQEALHNCERHSRATVVRIRVYQENDRLILRIQDDGQGFNVQQVKGLGLLGIEERVARLGGTSQVESKPGGGTILTVRLPLLRETDEVPADAAAEIPAERVET